MTVFVLGVFTGIVAFIIAILVATKIGYTLVFAWDDSKVKVNVPSADVVEVCRCKDCTKERTCNFAQYQGVDGYCSYGERKDG